MEDIKIMKIELKDGLICKLEYDGINIGCCDMDCDEIYCDQCKLAERGLDGILFQLEDILDLIRE